MVACGVTSYVKIQIPTAYSKSSLAEHSQFSWLGLVSFLFAHGGSRVGPASVCSSDTGRTRIPFVINLLLTPLHSGTSTTSLLSLTPYDYTVSLSPVAFSFFVRD